MDIQSSFESRDKTYLNLLKSNVYLTRLIRENTALFDVNIRQREVLFLTESDKVISANYEADDDSITLNNLSLLDVEEITSEKKHNEVISSKIKDFVSHTRKNSFSKMNESFDSILNSFDDRIKLERVKDKLKAKEVLLQTDAVDTRPFKKLNEIRELVSTFFKENEQVINENPELVYKIRLANAVSRSLMLDESLPLEEVEGTSHTFIKEDLDTPLFELVCKQEFLKAELFESRNSLYSSWVDSELITELITYAVEKEDLGELLETTITKFPYFVFLSKKDLVDLVESHFTVNGEKTISKKKTNEVVSALFEGKKPYKSYLTKVLNEKYGISLAHVKDVPSLKSLSKLHHEILTELAAISNENGIIHDVLVECARAVKNKSGIGLLHVNDSISSILYDSELDPVLTEDHRYLNLDQIKQDLLKIRGALAANLGGEAPMGAPAPEEEVPVEGEEQFAPEEEIPAGEGDIPPEAGEDQYAPEDDVPDPDAAAEQEAGEMQGGDLPPQEPPMGGEEGPYAPEEEAAETAVDEVPVQGEVGEEGSGITDPEEIRALVRDIEELLTGVGEGGAVNSPVDTEERDIYDD